MPIKRVVFTFSILFFLFLLTPKVFAACTLPKCFVENWPVKSPDTNAIWTSNNEVTFQQILTKGSVYWYRSDVQNNTWNTGTLFQNEENKTSNPFPSSLDTNTLFNYNSNVAQVITKGNVYWFRASTTSPWTGSGIVFVNEQISDSCSIPLPTSMDTNSIYANGTTRAQVVTKDNTYWFRGNTDSSWTHCGTYLKDSPIEALGTFENVKYKGDTISIISKNENTWILSNNTNDVVFQFDLTKNSVRSDYSPLILGSNLVWPFFQTNSNLDLSDEEVSNYMNSMGQSNFYRYPGGHWSEWYHWYWGIGSQEERPWTSIPPSGKPLPNSFGTTELIKLVQEKRGSSFQFILNYITGSELESQKWAEFVSGTPPNTIPSNWNATQWRIKIPITLSENISDTTTVVKVTDTSMFDYSWDQNQANCDNNASDGYGYVGCDRNKYEWKKVSAKIGNEWVIIDKVDKNTNTLTIRRPEKPRSHNKSEPAYIYSYNLDQPSGYFAWLRTLPEYGGITKPQRGVYWELGNEPYYGLYRGGCNYWMPCIPQKIDKYIYVNTYINTANKIKLIDPTAKMGLPIESVFDFTGLAEASTGWTPTILSTIPNNLIDFVSPHFYQGFTNIPNDNINLGLILLGPDKIYDEIQKIETNLKVIGIDADIIPNEFSIVYHQGGPFAWWTELGNDAGKWRDGLYLASLIARFAIDPNIKGANYWHLLWPGMLGKTGQNAYPFDQTYSNKEFSESGSSSKLYKNLTSNLFSNIYKPTLEINRSFYINGVNGIEGNNGSSTISILSKDTNSSNFSVILINRDSKPFNSIVEINNLNTFSPDNINEITLEGEYNANVARGTILNKTQVNTSYANNKLIYSKILPARSVVILSHKLKGDINSDKLVNNLDLTALTQYILGETALYHINTTDVNNDYRINIKDLINTVSVL